MNKEEELEMKIKQFEQLRHQYQNMAAQVIQVKQLIDEIQKGKNELDKLLEEEKIYREIGSIMIEVTDRKELITELANKKESMEIQLKSFMKQEDLLREEVEKSRSNIECIIKERN